MFRGLRVQLIGMSMKDFRFNYIITIHNKEDLIKEVLENVVACARENSYIYPVLDGCTDNTENIVNEVIRENPQVKITKVYAPNVHELKSINAGLRAASQAEHGFNIILQDDVILEDHNLESTVIRFYEYFGYEKVGYLGFRHGVNLYLKDLPEIVEMFNKKENLIEERNIIESAYGTGLSPKPLEPYMAVERMAAVGSPQCVSTYVVNKIGLWDEAMAPVSWTCHDISLRCLQVGLHNYAFAIKFKSDIEWGSTRSKPTPKHGDIYTRNRVYLHDKYFNFFKKFRKSQEYRRLKTANPFKIPSITVSEIEKKNAIKNFYKSRKSQMGLSRHLISKYIKLPLKFFLTNLRIY